MTKGNATNVNYHLNDYDNTEVIVHKFSDFATISINHEVTLMFDNVAQIKDFANKIHKGSKNL
jgi:hypothetical protein